LPSLLKSTLTAGQAAIDTGTSIILAPTATVLGIFAQIPGSIPIAIYGVEPTMWAYPCAAQAEVSLLFSGKAFAINPLDMNAGILTPGFGSMVGDPKLDPVLAAFKGGYCLAAMAGYDMTTVQDLTPFYVVVSAVPLALGLVVFR